MRIEFSQTHKNKKKWTYIFSWSCFWRITSRQWRCNWFGWQRWKRWLFLSLCLFNLCLCLFLCLFNLCLCLFAFCYLFLCVFSFIYDFIIFSFLISFFIFLFGFLSSFLSFFLSVCLFFFYQVRWIVVSDQFNVCSWENSDSSIQFSDKPTYEKN